MIDQTNIDRLQDAVVYAGGEKVGSVNQIFLDDDSGRPTWATVSTGLFGLKTSFVPIDDAVFDGERLDVNSTKDIIKDAPRIDADQHLSPAEERDLYAYYQRSARYEQLERHGYDVDAGRLRDDESDRIEDREDAREDAREAREERLEDRRDALRDDRRDDRAFLRAYSTRQNLADTPQGRDGRGGDPVI